MLRNVGGPKVGTGSSSPFRHSTITLSSASPINLSLVEKLQFVVPQSVLTQIPVATRTELPVCSRGVQTILAIQELKHFTVSKSEYIFIIPNFPLIVPAEESSRIALESSEVVTINPPESSLVIDKTEVVITNEPSVKQCLATSEFVHIYGPEKATLVSNSTEIVQINAPTRSILVIDISEPVLIQVLESSTSPLITESSMESSASHDVKFVADFIERNALQQQTRDEIRSELRVQVEKEFIVQRRKKCQVVQIVVLEIVHRETSAEITNSEEIVDLTDIIDSPQIVDFPESAEVPVAKSAFSTFLAITALIKFQRKAKRRYQQQQQDLLNSLGMAD